MLPSSIDRQIKFFSLKKHRINTPTPSPKMLPDRTPYLRDFSTL